MKNNKGFTLIEILVVIAIIGLLAVLIMVVTRSAMLKARDAKRISELDHLRNILEMYYIEHDAYPTAGYGSIPDGACIEIDSDSPSKSREAFQQDLVEGNYMGLIPGDPKFNPDDCTGQGDKVFPKDCYCYFYIVGEEANSYKLATHLEKGGVLINEGKSGYAVKSVLGEGDWPTIFDYWSTINTTMAGISWFENASGSNLFSAGDYQIRVSGWFTFWGSVPDEYYCVDAAAGSQEADDFRSNHGKVYGWCPGEHNHVGGGDKPYTVKSSTEPSSKFNPNYDTDPSGDSYLPHGPYIVFDFESSLESMGVTYFKVNEKSDNYYFVRIKRLIGSTSPDERDNKTAIRTFNLPAGARIGYHFSDSNYGDNSAQYNSSVAIGSAD